MNIFSEEDAQIIIENCTLGAYFTPAELQCLLNDSVLQSGRYIKQYQDNNPKSSNVKFFFTKLKKHSDGLLESLRERWIYRIYDEWMTSNNLHKDFSLLDDLENNLEKTKLIIDKMCCKFNPTFKEKIKTLENGIKKDEELIKQKKVQVEALQEQLKHPNLILERHPFASMNICLITSKNLSEIIKFKLPANTHFILKVKRKAKGYKFYISSHANKIVPLPMPIVRNIIKTKLAFPNNRNSKKTYRTLSKEERLKLITPKETVEMKKSMAKELNEAKASLHNYEEDKRLLTINLNTLKKKQPSKAGKKPANAVRGMIANLGLIYERNTKKKPRHAYYNKLKNRFSNNDFLKFCYEFLKILKTKYSPNEIKLNFGILYETRKEATETISVETREKIALNKTIEKVYKKRQ